VNEMLRCEGVLRSGSASGSHRIPGKPFREACCG
jgi:hypothetical protein